jgi:hypothetical protein
MTSIRMSAMATVAGAMAVVAASGCIVAVGRPTEGATGFVGTWARSGTQTVTCNGTTMMTSFTGDLVLTLGASSGSITGTTPDGCVANYAVSGNVATAMPGQTCNVTTSGGVAEVLTIESRTFTLSADGNTLTEGGSETIDKVQVGIMCSAASTGTYTRM